MTKLPGWTVSCDSSAESSAPRIKIGVVLKKGFFKAEGAQRYSTVSAATTALAEVGGGLVDIVYVVAGQPRLPVQGLVLPGGDDLDPRHYKRPDLIQHAENADYKQDAFELGLVNWAQQMGLPILGLCRGMQVLNVSRGGTLLPRLPNAAAHFQERAAKDAEVRPLPVHSLSIAPASKLWNVLESDTAEVNSIHKGGIDTLGDGLRATAWAEDGTVEALETESGAWAHAVQFHPEDLSRHDRRWLRLFWGFVQACREHRPVDGSD